LEPKENIEQLFKNAFEKHEEQVSSDLWNKISNDLNNVPSDGSQTSNTTSGTEQLSQAISGSKGLGLGFWGGAAIVAVTATTFYFVSQSDESNSTIEDKQQSVLTEETTPTLSPVIDVPANEGEPVEANSTDLPVNSKVMVGQDETTGNVVVAPESNSSATNSNQNNNSATSTEQDPVLNNPTGIQANQSNSTPITSSDNITIETASTEGSSSKPQISQDQTDTPGYQLAATPKRGVAPLDVNLKLFEFHGEVTWDFGDGASGFGGTTISHQYEIPGTYTAWAKFTDGSGEEHSQPIIIIVEADDFLKNFIPNVFTPNGDGTNEVFTIKSDQLSSVDVSIYDRRGRQIARFTDPDIGWDGLIEGGTQAEQGTYFYVIYAQGTDGQTHNYKGTLKLIR
jgi:gliding motility-associated-like protein